MDAYKNIDWLQFDFIDLGCSSGGSLRYCQKRFGAKRGLGIDLSAEKVDRARTAGFDVVRADALALPPQAQVSFVSMMDFLEHLPNLEVVEAIIGAASQAASDFLFIRHPSFEGEGYLAALGFQQYWWNWSGHTVHIHVSDYCVILERLGLRQYFVRYREPVLDSNHPSIIPAKLPKNQREYDPDVHPPKPSITFAEPLWRAQDIFVALREFDPHEWARVTGPTPRPKLTMSEPLLTT